MAQYEYFCTECKIKIETDQSGYIKCPQCNSGTNIRDFEDYDEPLWAYCGKDFNWNKK